MKSKMFPNEAQPKYPQFLELYTTIQEAPCCFNQTLLCVNFKHTMEDASQVNSQIPQEIVEVVKDLMKKLDEDPIVKKDDLIYVKERSDEFFLDVEKALEDADKVLENAEKVLDEGKKVVETVQKKTNLFCSLFCPRR